MGAAFPAASPEVSIIVPARNEEVCLADCLRSLVAQRGVALEIIVVDDQSADRTREIAGSFSGVRVISSGPLPPGWTGKNNAVVEGVGVARGSWLLFTDADTVHLPGSLARALREAKDHHAEMLSYSPQQVVETFWERAVMPVVFGELAATYPPDKVRDQSSGVVAANGQYILVKRSAYESVGGHAAVADKILEDVALARAFRTSGFKVHFRYGADAVRTRMYRSWRALRDGWTKNLALLFPRPGWHACGITAWWALAWIALPLLIPAFALYRRLRRANFSPGTTLLATVFGPPAFSYLLLRSLRASTRGRLSWKGRTYSGNAGASAKQFGGTPGTVQPPALESRH